MTLFQQFIEKSKQRMYLLSIVASVLVIQVFYYVQVTYVYQGTYLSRMIIIPIIVGVLLGVMFGTIINQYRQIKKSESFKQSLEEQQLINQILILSKSAIALEPFLDKVLQIVIEAPFAKLEYKAGIFTLQPDGKYRIVSNINLDINIMNSCATKGIEPGQCLCGIAIQKKKTVYKKCVDHDHDIGFTEMKDHGHYNVPIIYKDEVLGVLVFYLEVGHQKSTSEVSFLESVADILALVFHRRILESKAKQKERELISAKKLAGLAFWEVDVNTQKLTWSDEAFDMLGYDRSHVKLDNAFHFSIIHDDDKEKFATAAKNAQEGLPFEIELRYIQKNGDFRYVINKCTPNLNEDGVVHKLAGIILDITDVRESQKEVEKQGALIENIIDSSPYALFLVDLEEPKILISNNEFDRIVSKEVRTQFELSGLSALSSFFHLDDIPLFDRTIKKLRKGKKKMYQFEARFAYDLSHFRWVQYRLCPFRRNEEGVVTQVLIVSIDIHEQKSAEEKIQNLNNKLVQQNEKLLKTNQELDRFIYSAAHDLRSPLTSILGLVNLYQMDEDTVNRNDYMDKIKTSVDKLDGVIHEIIDYAKITKTELNIAEVDINTLISEVFEGIKFAFPNKRIVLSMPDGDKHTVVSDASRIKIVLNNLLGNAVKYCDESKDLPEIRCELIKKDSVLNLKISDNGIGIESKYLGKIFNMFYRATNLSKGSGLGLYIAKEAAHKISASISISSVYQQGTEVLFSVPDLYRPIDEKQEALEQKL